MCIIMYKPANVAFPVKKVMKTCFENNPDGAGFMYAVDNSVFIQKGFMGFSSFNKALRKVRNKYGDDIPYVLHFRISTQAGVRQDCCHPYPLSRNMDDLRQLSAITDIGIAHNGIIDLTSTYSKTPLDYNDTMKFITDYMALIIKGRNFYRSNDVMTLIERLADSKLAILDGSGRCTLIGKFVEDNGVFYSNTTYQQQTYYSFRGKSYYDYYGWETVDTPKHKEVNENISDEHIDMYNCAYENYGTFNYCKDCIDKNQCPEYVYNGQDYMYGRYIG